MLRYLVIFVSAAKSLELFALYLDVLFFCILYHPVLSVSYTVLCVIICHTNVAYDASKLIGMKLFMSNNNTIYCSIIFANRIETFFNKLN
jgi:hypothetical protein